MRIYNNPAFTGSLSLSSLASKSSQVLFKGHSLFPFDLFPDYLTIDENKVNFVYHDFIGSEEVHSVMIADITDVMVHTTFFLASLQVIDSSNTRFPIILTISSLSVEDALRARRIIQGMITIKTLGATLADHRDQERVAELENLGKAREIE